MATISNRASASYSYVGAREPATVDSNIANTNLVEDYSLEVEKQSSSNNFVPGENITYYVRITNTGVNPLTSFTLTDNLGLIPGGTVPLTYLVDSGRIIFNNQISTIIPTSTNPLTFTIPNTLENGESLVVSYVATVSPTLDTTTVNNIINTISVSGTDGTGTASGNASVTLPVRLDANVIITKQVSKTDISSTDNFSYFLNLVNTGALDAENVVITDTLPEGFSVQSITIEQNGTSYTYGASEYTIDTSTNTLTLPNNTGRAINIPGFEEGIDNSARITINGDYNV